MDALALRAPVALVRLFALIAICHATVQLDHGVVPIARKEHVPTSVTPSNASVGDIKTQLKICECQKATGSPNGLSCGEKEGWFISSFEREGSWLSGGGLVPLSHAICCRPCLPDELPPTEAPIAKDDKPVGIMSMGCHASSGTGPFSLQCEPRGNSVVTGWAEAVLVSSSIDAYYPLGSAACCTPSLLLESGAAWELERCDCTQSGDIDCGGINTHRFLTGFDRWRMTRIGQFVPVAPANCCKMCLSDTVRPLDRCEDLNMCSGHGMCVTGACECSPGYSGADCGVKTGFGYQGLPQWLISLIIMCSCATLCLFMLIGNRLIRFFHLRAIAAEGEEEQVQEPLLPGLVGEDDDGSVGSEDTTDDDSEADEAARLVDDALAVAAAEEAEEAAQGDDDAASTAALGYMESPNLLNGTATGAGSHSSIQDLAAPYSSTQGAGPPANQPQQAEEAHPADLSQQAEAAHLQQMSDAETTGAEVHEVIMPASNYHNTSGDANDTIVDIPDKQEETAGRRRHEKGEGPPGVPGRDCNVCMVRAVQVALIPCGHACMCRRCSRRLSRCPVCRKEILRRQRLFI